MATMVKLNELGLEFLPRSDLQIWPTKLKPIFQVKDKSFFTKQYFWYYCPDRAPIVSRFHALKNFVILFFRDVGLLRKTSSQRSFFWGKKVHKIRKIKFFIHEAAHVRCINIFIVSLEIIIAINIDIVLIKTFGGICYEFGGICNVIPCQKY